ncbi:MAG: peptidoglycan bridge formation glycyltransferase FemA/FemB family protein [Patescibacteria group bacterium]|nr:peptidoglycan bridge formation glycyltransferase FemA/FemB family protein [Patescibacteria group bacterium]
MFSFKEITEEKIWNEFVLSCDPNTFLNSFAWGEVETDLGRKVIRIGIFDGNEQIGALLAVLVPARRGSILLCPHGPLVKDRVSIEEVLPDVRDELSRIGRIEKCVCVRICPLLSDIPEHRKIFSSCGFKPAPIHVYSELSWILDITPPEAALLSGMKKNTRYGIRKAEKDGVTVSSSIAVEDIDTFWRLYVRTADRQGFVVYPRSMIEAEFRRFAERGKARWYFAKFQETLVSAALIVYSDTTAFYHHGASLHATGSITPGEALQWKIIKDAKASGLKRYNFWGVVPDDQPKHPWAGLSKFKKGFGGYPEAYVHAQDLPLSLRYWIMWAIETFRRWKRRV